MESSEIKETSLSCSTQRDASPLPCKKNGATCEIRDHGNNGATADQSSGKKDHSAEEKEGDVPFYNSGDLSSDYFQSITRKGQPLWCKIIWVVLIITLTSLAIYTAYNLLHDYFEYNSYNQHSVNWESEEVLPAMTICNLNVVDNEKLMEDLVEEDVELAETIQTGMNNFLHQVIQKVKRGDGLEVEDLYMSMEMNNINIKGRRVNILTDYHTTFSTFMLGTGVHHAWVEFGGKWLDPLTTGHSFVNTELGNCLSLNDDQAMVQELGGVRGGMTVDLNTRVEHYLPSTRSAGFMLFLRQPYETLLNNIDGIYIPAGKETFVSLTRETISRLKEPFGNCQTKHSFFNSSVHLSGRECIQNEYFTATLGYCECAPWYFVDAVKKFFSDKQQVFNDAMKEKELTFTYDNLDENICTFVDQTVCDYGVVNELGNIDISDICHEPCNYTLWHHRTESGDFPATPGYYERYLKDTAAHPNIDNLEDYDETYEYAHHNFVRLHVYYDDLKVVKTTQTKSYEVFNFISQFGGATDLFVGVSFFTLFQLSEILIAWILFRCCSKKKKGKSEDAAIAVE